jgi:hypothetical protein
MRGVAGRGHTRLNRQKKEQEDLAHVQKLLQEVKLRELAAERHRTENTLDYVAVGHKSTPSPKKKKLPRRDKDQASEQQVTLPRLDFSGKNSKNVRNIKSGRGLGNNATDEGCEENEVLDFVNIVAVPLCIWKHLTATARLYQFHIFFYFPQNDNIVVTVGVQDNYHRKANLHTTRNSKSEQSKRAVQAKDSRRNRRLHAQSSHSQLQAEQEGAASPHHPAVTHVVHIGKPSRQTTQPLVAPAAAAAAASQGTHGQGHGHGHAQHTTAQSRFDAFDNDDDDDFFGDDDDGELSDDSLTRAPPGPAARRPPPKGHNPHALCYLHHSTTSSPGSFFWCGN